METTLPTSPWDEIVDLGGVLDLLRCNHALGKPTLTARQMYEYGTSWAKKRGRGGKILRFPWPLHNGTVLRAGQAVQSDRYDRGRCIPHTDGISDLGRVTRVGPTPPLYPLSARQCGGHLRDLGPRACGPVPIVPGSVARRRDRVLRPQPYPLFLGGPGAGMRRRAEPSGNRSLAAPPRPAKAG